MAELNGCGFPVAACASLDAATGELGAARDELAAAREAVAWVAPMAERFRAAADAQWIEAAALADAGADAAGALRRQGALYATAAECAG
jgi:hypothetical protein